MEGDVDWDLRIKSQMLDFARASSLLLQPGRENDLFNIGEEPTMVSKTSPFGDVSRWDLLWLGHCGAQFVEDDRDIHHGRVVISNDVTVPETQHLDTEYGTKELVLQYPNHTRVVHRSRMNVCSLAYGVSQSGARRFLYELGIKRLNYPMDIMMREMCDGLGGRPIHSCLTVQPQLFQHHHPVGSTSGFSEVQDHGAKYNPLPWTKNIRWSTRGNFRKLIDEQTDFTDLFRDGEPSDLERFEAVDHP